MLYFLVIEFLVFLFLGNLLILEKISKNSWLGYRTPKSLASDENWYRCNKVLGYNLIACALLQLLLILFFSNRLGEEIIQGVISGGLPLLAVTSTFLIIKFKHI